MDLRLDAAARTALGLALASVFCLTCPVRAQQGATDGPVSRAQADQTLHERGKTHAEMERELRKIRARYFRNIRNTEIRQLGIQKLREYTDPMIFPTLLELFEDEDQDVRTALLDHLQVLGTDEADATLAWAAVFGEDEWYRDAAGDRVLVRVGEAGDVSRRIKSVVAEGLRREDNDTLSGAANLANTLGLFEAIPMLINAQIGGQQGGASGGVGDGDGALAYILVGTQTAFVSDLQPIVGESAVGFDPELSVVTEGVVLRVIDAVTMTYRVDVHSALVGLSSRGWGGRSTAGLGWDNVAWRTWYHREFLPYRRQQDALAREALAQRQAVDSGRDPADHSPADDSGG